MAVTPVSVSLGSRGILTSTHSCDAVMSLPVSHWFSPAALAALSVTSALLGAALLEDASWAWPLVRAVADPSSTSVKPALATVGSVPGSSLDSTAESTVSSSTDGGAASVWEPGAAWVAACLTWATGES